MVFCEVNMTFGEKIAQLKSSDDILCKNTTQIDRNSLEKLYKVIYRKTFIAMLICILLFLSLIALITIRWERNQYYYIIATISFFCIFLMIVFMINTKSSVKKQIAIVLTKTNYRNTYTFFDDCFIWENFNDFSHAVGIVNYMKVTNFICKENNIYFRYENQIHYINLANNDNQFDLAKFLSDKTKFNKKLIR